MEAKIEKREIIDITFFKIESANIQLDYHYRSAAEYLSDQPSALFISFDNELSEELVKTVVNSYSGSFPVFHSFKTDKLYLSNITQYMIDIFHPNSSKEVING